jgi:hypothetical protein
LLFQESIMDIFWSPIPHHVWWETCIALRVKKSGLRGQALGKRTLNFGIKSLANGRMHVASFFAEKSWLCLNYDDIEDM